MKILFASKNKGKIKEVEEIFSETKFEILSLLNFDIDEIEETGSTFEANAKIKAETAFAKIKLPVIADDSGLCVEQLDNRPGVFSARYSGENATAEKNIDLLLSELKNHKQPHNAKFVCCAFYFDGTNYFAEQGEVTGEIIYERKGTHGFGYDPVFFLPQFDKTMAELDSDTKNKISHRGIAFRKLHERILHLEK